MIFEAISALGAISSPCVQTELTLPVEVEVINPKILGASSGQHHELPRLGKLYVLSSYRLDTSASSLDYWSKVASDETSGKGQHCSAQLYVSSDVASKSRPVTFSVSTFHPDKTINDSIEIQDGTAGKTRRRSSVDIQYFGNHYLTTTCDHGVTAVTFSATRAEDANHKLADINGCYYVNMVQSQPHSDGKIITLFSSFSLGERRQIEATEVLVQPPTP